MSESKLWQRRAGLITEDEYQGSMEEAGFNLSKNDTPNVVGNEPRTVQDLAVKLRDIGLKLRMMKGIDSMEIKAVGKLLDDILSKIQTGTIGTAITAADKSFNNSTKGFNISKNDTPNVVGGK